MNRLHRSCLRFSLVLLGALVAVLGTARADALRVLSGGAIEPGIRPVISAFEKASGHTVSLGFATAPQIRQRVDAGERFDVVIAPPAVLDALVAASHLPPDAPRRVAIGSVGLGVAVRRGAPLPDIASAEAFKQALREADSLVFNRASTGLYVEGLLKQLGIEAETAAKTTRYADGASVMAHLVQGRGRELGLGAVTEILLAHDQGVQLVGPLPAPLQNLTRYAASPADASPSPAVGALLAWLGSADAIAAYNAAGITPMQ